MKIIDNIWDIYLTDDCVARMINVRNKVLTSYGIDPENATDILSEYIKLKSEYIKFIDNPKHDETKKLLLELHNHYLSVCKDRVIKFVEQFIENADMYKKNVRGLNDLNELAIMACNGLVSLGNFKKFENKLNSTTGQINQAKNLLEKHIKDLEEKIYKLKSISLLRTTIKTAFPNTITSDINDPIDTLLKTCVTNLELMKISNNEFNYANGISTYYNTIDLIDKINMDHIDLVEKIFNPANISNLINLPEINYFIDDSYNSFTDNDAKERFITKSTNYTQTTNYNNPNNANQQQGGNNSTKTYKKYLTKIQKLLRN